MIYIEQCLVENSYQPEVFFQKISETVSYDRDWPLICAGSYHREDLLAKTFVDFNGGKRRTRPSYCAESSYESVERVIGSSLGMRGPVSTLSAACVSCAYAIDHAYALSVIHGTPVIVASASRMIEGGYGRFWFTSFGAIDEPTGISFDKNSRGFSPGEAMTFTIVSAKPIDPIASISHLRFYTQTQEVTNVGSIQQIYENLFKQLDVKDVCWWNAHAPGTPVGDTAEYELFRQVIGDRDVPISSMKGQYGHSVTSCYSFELAKGIEALKQGFIPYNHRLQDPINDDPRIITAPVATQSKKYLKFNMGFGGKNVVSLIEIV